ncbi:cytochrome c [candidate division KSB1 bacterium]|nr:cytochrome c [candidate division KSB1 bacterium]
MELIERYTMTWNIVYRWGILFLLILLFGCGSDQKDSAKIENIKKNDTGLSSFELENGIGPIKEKLVLAPIEPQLLAKGKEIFKLKCQACHKLDTRFIGPALRYVAKRRSPEYIMNMMLNPDEMVKKHPEAKKVLTEYLAPMTNQNLSIEDARAVLGYFRNAAQEGQTNNIPEVPLFKQ